MCRIFAKARFNKYESHREFGRNIQENIITMMKIPRSPATTPSTREANKAIHSAVLHKDEGAIKLARQKGSRANQLDENKRTPTDLLAGMQEIDNLKRENLYQALMKSSHPSAPKGYTKPETFHGSHQGLETLQSNAFKGGANEPKVGTQSLEGKVFFSERVPLSDDDFTVSSDLLQNASKEAAANFSPMGHLDLDGHVPRQVSSIKPVSQRLSSLLKPLVFIGAAQQARIAAAQSGPPISKIMAMAFPDMPNFILLPREFGGVITPNNQAAYFTPSVLKSIQMVEPDRFFTKPKGTFSGQMAYYPESILTDKLLSAHLNDGLLSGALSLSELQQFIPENSLKNIADDSSDFIDSKQFLPPLTFLPYTGISLRDAFADGIPPLGNRNLLMEHVGGATDTNFLTTTKDCAFAASCGQDNSFFVVRPYRGFDINRIMKDAELLEFYDYTKEYPVLIQGGIEPQDILGFIDMPTSLFISNSSLPLF